MGYHRYISIQYTWVGSYVLCTSMMLFLNFFILIIVCILNRGYVISTNVLLSNEDNDSDTVNTLINNVVDDDIDSDYLFLYVKQSTLPIENAGLGVFAKVDIPAGEIICEFRGLIYKNEHESDRDTVNRNDINPNKNNQSDKLFSIQSIDNINYMLNGNSICSLVNDAVQIVVDPPYTKGELRSYAEAEHRNSIPTHDGDQYQYNAYYNETVMGKVFLMSVNDIKANSEIFFSYGK